MAEKFEIKIESILGGMSGFENFSAPDQYKFAYGIDPDASLGNYGPSGYIVPTFLSSLASFANVPLWMETEPKIGTNLFVYDFGGSVYTTDWTTITGLTDLNDGGTASGNGFAYYDNYIYAARDTTIARYGPLNGTPTWTDDYWVTTLGLTALTNTTYPRIITLNSARQPNHILHRHNDGRLYVADVVGNQGVVHYVSTTKTTVEGDTNSGSTYNAVDFPYGFWPTAMASYGDELAVALYEGTSNPTTRPKRAKIAFWDTTNPNTYNTITEVEFPDTFISALVNSNGILYVFSGEPASGRMGVRVCRFVGGHAFEQVAYIQHASLPAPGAIETELNKIIFGSSADQDQASGCVYSIGSKLDAVSNNIFSIIGNTSAAGMGEVSSLKFGILSALGQKQMLLGAYGSGSPNNYLWRYDNSSSLSGDTSSRFISQTYRLGRRWKVTKVIMNLTSTLDNFANVTIIPKINGTSLTTINNTAYPSLDRVVIRPEGLTGYGGLTLQIDFGGSIVSEGVIPGITLPIIIEGEYLDD